MAKLIGTTAVTFMLAVSLHAEATCAWVLIEPDTESLLNSFLGRKWVVNYSFDSEAACRKQEETWARRAHDLMKASERGDYKGTSTAAHILRSHCIPAELVGIYGARPGSLRR
jgi:hypothetical protein